MRTLNYVRENFIIQIVKNSTGIITLLELIFANKVLMENRYESLRRGRI